MFHTLLGILSRDTAIGRGPNGSPLAFTFFCIDERSIADLDEVERMLCLDCTDLRDIAGSVIPGFAEEPVITTVPLPPAAAPVSSRSDRCVAAGATWPRAAPAECEQVHRRSGKGREKLTSHVDSTSGFASDAAANANQCAMSPCPGESGSIGCDSVCKEFENLGEFLTSGFLDFLQRTPANAARSTALLSARAYIHRNLFGYFYFHKLWPQNCAVNCQIGEAGGLPWSGDNLAIREEFAGG